MGAPRQPDRNRELPQWLVRFISRVTPSCAAVTQLVSLSYDRPLTWKERLQLHWHYKICYFCIRYHDHLEIMHQGLKGHEEAMVAARRECLPPEAAEEIRQALAGTPPRQTD